MTAAAPTWRTVLAEDRRRLEGAAVEAAAAEARWLVEEAAGCAGADLAARLDEPPTRRALAHHDSMLTRRLAGEPLQYVLGRWAFRSLDLAVDRRALIPRPETEQVVEVALGELDRVVAGGRSAPVVVDLGTGSGAIALSIAVERPRSRVWATDRSVDALALARANLAGIGRAGARVRLLEGDWCDALPADLRGAVDVMVANPPYVADGASLPAAVADWEPAEALRGGPDGLDELRRIVAQAPSWLRSGGALVVEHDPAQAEPLRRLASEAGFVEVEVVDDLSSRPRALRGRRPG